MHALRHQRVSALFVEAARLAPESRRAFLDSRCGDDPTVADEVIELLEHHEKPRVAVVTGAVHVGDVLDAVGFDAAATPGPALGSAFSSVARYRILRVLGEGGMGTVYLAEQDRPRRSVALKVMRAGTSGADRLRKRFEREAEMLGRLEHPGIARIYDAGTATLTTGDGSQTVPYFAMEFVDGPPLIEFAEVHHLSIRDRMSLLAKVADAVGAAHGHGIVHRDLKPANILVDPSGQPKVLDFGVARATDADLAVTTVQTDVGQLIGTFGYMSPEQVVGDPSMIDARTDVYALGAVAHELLAGQPLVDTRGRTVPEIARVIRDEEPRSLSSIDRVFRGDLETIVGKALEKDPARRYASASALADDIRRYLHDEPIVARPPTTMYQLRKFARRNRALVTGVVAAFLALAVGLVGTTFGFFEARQQRDRAIAAQERADTRFDQTRKLAKIFIYELDDMLANLPGSTPVREKVVTTALEYLDALAAEAAREAEASGADPETAQRTRDLQMELSEAYMRVGQVQGYGSKANLGDRAGALESFGKALEIRQRLLDADPNDEKVLRAITTTRNHIGHVRLAQNRYAEGREAYLGSLAIRERLLAAAPGDRDRTRDVFLSEQNIGNSYRLEASAVARDGDEAKARALLDDALVHYGRSHELAIALRRDGDVGSIRDLSVACEKMGDVKGDLGAEDEAVAFYRESLEARRSLLAAEPENTEHISDLASSLSKLGNRMLAQKRFDESRECFNESLALATRVADADPANVLAQVNLLVSDYRMALLGLAESEDESLPPSRRSAAIDDASVYADRAVELVRSLDADGKLDEAKKPWIAEMEGLATKVRERRASEPTAAGEAK